MRHRILSSLVACLVVAFLMTTQVVTANAAACSDGGYYSSISCNFPANGDSRSTYPLAPNQQATCTVLGLNSPSSYQIVLRNDYWATSSPFASSNIVNISSTESNNASHQSTFTITFPRSEYNNNFDFNVNLLKDGNEVCQIAKFTYKPEFACIIRVSQVRQFTDPTEELICYSPNCLDSSTDTYVEVKVSNKYEAVPYKFYRATVEGLAFPVSPTDSGVVTLTKKFTEVKTHKIEVEDIGTSQKICSVSFSIADRCSTTDRTTCGEEPPIDEDSAMTTKFSLCSQLKKDSPEEASCEKCLGQNGVWTAIGCISAEPEEMIAHFIRLGIGLGGGVALLMTLIGGFLMTTSQGNPKQQEQAKEMITSAVIGLLFVLFSVVLLQFIGVTILQIPGFGGPSTAGTP